MSRREGTLKLSSNIEPRASAPLDARLIVPTLADLTASGAFPYPYVGMIVSVQSEGKAYMLTASDTTDSANWTEIGSGGESESIQVATLPSAALENVGTIYQYIGSNATLQYFNLYNQPIINGRFYQSQIQELTIDQKRGSGGSPKAYHLYELVEGEYVLTNDTVVYADKTYYEARWTPIYVQQPIQVTQLPENGQNAYKYVNEVYQLLSDTYGVAQRNRFYTVGYTKHPSYQTAYSPAGYRCFEFNSNTRTYQRTTDNTWVSGKTYYDAKWMETEVQKPTRLTTIYDARETVETRKIIDVGDIIIYSGEDTVLTDSDNNAKKFLFGHTYVVRQDTTSSTTSYWWEEIVSSIPTTDTLPTASIEEYGNVYIYVGNTTDNYKHDTIYRCEDDTNDERIYIINNDTITSEIWNTIISQCNAAETNVNIRYTPKQKLYWIGNSTPYACEVRFFNYIKSGGEYRVSIIKRDGTTDSDSFVIGTTVCTVFKYPLAWISFDDVGAGDLLQVFNELPEPIGRKTGECALLGDEQTGYTKGDIYQTQLKDTVVFDGEQIYVAALSSVECLRGVNYSSSYYLYWPQDGYEVYVKGGFIQDYTKISHIMYEKNNYGNVLSFTVYFAEGSRASEVYATSAATTPTTFYLMYKANDWVSINNAEGGSGGVIPVDPSDTSNINIWIETL